MEPFLTEQYANPSGMHAAARASKTALEAARETVADECGCEPREVVFTGGGSEGDNLAVKGAAWALRDGAGADGVVTTGIEHKAVLGACDRLAREGFRVARIGAGADGVADLGALAGALDDLTAVVSVMLVNNETGIVQPLAEVVALVRERAPGAVVHTDAVQAPAWLDLRVATAGSDLVTISGHKFGGPKGVGALVVRDGVELIALIDGGGHEGARRAGTQNVAGIVGLAAALHATDAQRSAERARIAELRDRLQAGLARMVPGFGVNGDPLHRVEGILNCAFAGIEAETLLVVLDQHDVYASSGSACGSGAIDPSHVLLAMGIAPERAGSSIRFSLGYATTAADIDAALQVVPDAVHRLVEAAA
ncbi:MAG: cysteine desulfurase [Actinomycetota bacterium]|nr:cysteine desulfurase [Actinomycetota bacterium]